ncbi:ABC transporter permease [Helicobacter monodelphidis]|uniref:ABC transporter permease n=1 Tax=Helicobacter sp. 15-1451 TaxID=2004995 RepID=UPI000DCD5D1C|nr:ABC transporter permease [Helicobacter sp. 15-1451]RAX57994.1 ABC transporter permease [Helicobacter sp. 15-1451]
MNTLNKKRIQKFFANKRAKYSLYLFGMILFICIAAPFIANDRPLVVSFNQQWYFPIFKTYPETTFGGDFESEANYHDSYIQELIQSKGWLLFPPIPYRYDTIIMGLSDVAPTPPDSKNFLGTDDQSRDLLSRLIYGYAISLAFGLLLTFFSSIIGIIVGAIMGYYGGKIDLFSQRFVEIYSSMPVLFLVIIFSSVIESSFWWLLLFLSLFSWVGLVNVVRAEFLRGRNLDYVRSSKALGASDCRIIFKHILPNAFPIILSFLPFVLSSSITMLTSLDFLGFGLPVGSPSLGEVLNQAKENLYAPWIGISAFISIAFLLSVLVFIGEGLRDAFDPRNG